MAESEAEGRYDFDSMHLCLRKWNYYPIRFKWQFLIWWDFPNVYYNHKKVEEHNYVYENKLYQ